MKASAPRKLFKHGLRWVPDVKNATVIWMRWQPLLSCNLIWTPTQIYEMTHIHTPSRSVTCLLLLIIFVCLLVVSGIAFPRLVTSQAEQLFGPASNQLNSIQRLYLFTLLLLQSG